MHSVGLSGAFSLRFCHFADSLRFSGWLVDVISIVSESRNVQIRWFWPINSLSLLRLTLVVSGNAIKWLHAFSLRKLQSGEILWFFLKRPLAPRALRKFKLKGWIEKVSETRELSLYWRPIKIEELKTAGAHWRRKFVFYLNRNRTRAAVSRKLLQGFQRNLIIQNFLT